MTKARKVDILYKKAHGQPHNATPAELNELKNYRVDSGDSKWATKKNITDYVSAVDRGERGFSSFYDWCMNNCAGDRRRKDSSKEAMQRENRSGNFAAGFIGWLTWGLALYWLFNGALPVLPCAIIGIVISIALRKFSRVDSMALVFGLPIVVCVVAYFIHHH